MTATNAARFLCLAGLWGGSFSLIRISLEGLAPAQLTLTRLVLGAVVLAAVAAFRRVLMPRGLRLWAHLGVAAVLGNVAPFLLLGYGEQTTGAGLAGVLVGTTPLLTMGLALAVLPTESANRRKAAGLLIGFVGMMVVVGPSSEMSGSIGGRLACLGAALSYAAGFVYVRRFLTRPELSPIALATAQVGAAAVLQLLMTPLFAWQTPDLTGRVVLGVTLLGVLGTGVAYVLYFRLIADLGATTAASVNYAVPVLAVVVGVVVLGEPVTLPLVLGGLIVLVGLVVATWRTSSRSSATSPASSTTRRLPASRALARDCT